MDKMNLLNVDSLDVAYVPRIHYFSFSQGDSPFPVVRGLISLLIVECAGHACALKSGCMATVVKK
jgi:hypothetical protein